MESPELTCPVCFRPNLTGRTHADCSGPLGGLVSVFKHSGPARRAIHFLKYKRMASLASDLVFLSGKRIYENPHEYGPFAEFLFSSGAEVTFVPMEKSRERRRGYNQAELVAKCLASLAGKKPVVLLEKSGTTRPQTELSGKDRLGNLEGSFSISVIRVPERVVLVDDVVTTGSTMRECARVLKRAGAVNVWGFSLTKT